MAFSYDNNNSNNRGNFPRANENLTQKEYEKKSLEEYSKYKEVLDRKSTKELNDYRLKLYMSSDTLTYKQRIEKEKKFLEWQRKQREKEEKKLREYIEHEEQELALQRKQEREEEKADQKRWLEGQLELYKETLKSDTASLKDKVKALAGLTQSDEFGKKVDKFVSSFNSGINETMSTYSKYMSTIDTRLRGTDKTFSNLRSTLMGGVGVTPYLKTQTMLDNLQKLVESGIAFNLEQRAFLSSVSDKIASTFNAFDSNLLRIVRLQQADSTASRLGMESYMTKFLNNMFSDTSYLSGAFDTVTGNLVEATSQMSTKMGVEFEYTVQKWLGSLSSVGLSDATVSNISQAMGYLATGNVQGLESSGMQNLVVMAASKAGLSYADMLTRGININETNRLLGSMVQYLQQIGSSTNQVVKNQYASTFGVSISDLRAASNLSVADLRDIGANGFSYQRSMDELTTGLNTIGQRVSIAEKLQNVSSNAMFSLYSSIADNPALMSLWTVTDMIQQNTGGINIPSVLGTGPNTTVENLMKLGVIGVGSLGMIGDIVSGLSSTANFAGVMGKLGGQGLITTGRGSGVSSSDSGYWTSDSTYIGQSSGSSFYENTMESSKRQIQNQITNNEVASEVDMKKDIATPIAQMNTNILAILQQIRDYGVKVGTYGLATGNTNEAETNM